MFFTKERQFRCKEYTINAAQLASCGQFYANIRQKERLDKFYQEKYLVDTLQAGTWHCASNWLFSMARNPICEIQDCIIPKRCIKKGQLYEFSP